LAEQLHIVDQMPGRIVLKCRMRPAPAAPALIEQHCSILARVEKASSVYVPAATGPPMHEKSWYAVWLADLLKVDFVAIADIEKT
jgi:hypothetical protein